MDAIRSINEAEENARRLKANAIADARKAINDAEKAGSASVEEGRRQGEEEGAALIKKAEQLAVKEIEDLYRNTENKKAVSRAAVEKRLNSAADYIVGKVVNG